jgi:hypothetical protein
MAFIIENIFIFNDLNLKFKLETIDDRKRKCKAGLLYDAIMILN